MNFIPMIQVALFSKRMSAVACWRIALFRSSPVCHEVRSELFPLLSLAFGSAPISRSKQTVASVPPLTFRSQTSSSKLHPEINRKMIELKAT